MTGIPGDTISAATRYCAVLGHPIRHSASPAMQNAGLAALGLDWRYLAFEVGPGDLATAIAGARAMRFVGLNLTIPHKQSAVGLVDVLDESARAWGAVNTIRFEAQDGAGRWQSLGTDPELGGPVRSCGFNTDGDGLVAALREDLGMVLRGLRVWVVGTGGSGRVAALKLASEGVAAMWLLNRTESKAQGLAEEVTHRWPGVEVGVGYPPDRVDLLVNCTSAGLRAADPLPIDPGRFPLRRAGAVYDLIYRPAETPLLAEARRAGCRAANGLGMLLHQGTRALELWTGRAAPAAVMRAALEAAVWGQRNA